MLIAYGTFSCALNKIIGGMRYMLFRAYNRMAAVYYAHQWAFNRNPMFYSFDELGGDCTNFVSQCVYAGTGVMNDTPDFGWYYINGNDKAPAWTGVPYFYNFITREGKTMGPFGQETPISHMQLGDVVQMKFRGNEEYGHSAIVVSTGLVPNLYNTLLAAHNQDADFRPLYSYDFSEIRFLHIQGVIL